MRILRALGGTDFSAVVRLARNRDFALYSGGKILANLGEWAQRVTIGWLTWQLTESAFWLGVIGFADLFPTVVIGAIAGTVVDRSDYMKLVKGVQVAAVLVSLALTLFTAFGALTIGILAVLTLLRGIAQAFYRPARMVLVYNLVDDRDLPSAIAISSIIFNAARFVGPAVGGALMLWGGPVLSFAVAAATYVLFLVALQVMDVAPMTPARAGRRGLLRETADGVRHAFSAPGIALLLVVVIVIALAVRPFLELLPAFADEVFAGGIGSLTLLLTANGLGATLAGLWLAGRPGGVSGLTRVVVANVLAIGLSVAAFALVPWLWLALPLLTVAGFCLVVQGVAVQTLVQASVAPAMRGRVLGLYALLARGCPALGALAIGGLAEWLGPQAPVAIGGALAVVLWLLLLGRREAVARAVERRPDEAPKPVSEHGDVAE
ncbi:MAG: MFS transporter [Alphaproteobacteria bacterium]